MWIFARRAFQAEGRGIQKRRCAWLSTESSEPRVPVAGPRGAGETAHVKLNRRQEVTRVTGGPLYQPD